MTSKKMSLPEKKVWRKITGVLEEGDAVRILAKDYTCTGKNATIKKIIPQPEGILYEISFTLKQWKESYSEIWNRTYTLLFWGWELELVA